MARQDYAIVIGIEDYPRLMNGQRVTDAHADADRFVDWLHTCVGLSGADRLKVIKSDNNPNSPKPDNRLIDDAYKAIIRQAHADYENAREDEHRLYVYFAGHGTGKDGYRDEHYVNLLMANASRANVYGCLDEAEYRLGLQRVSLFTEQLFFFDCCRNDDSVWRGQVPNWDEIPLGPEKQPAQWVYYASAPYQRANRRMLVRDEPRTGLFTAALLEGLKGCGNAAQSVPEGRAVTTDSLLYYMVERMKELAQTRNVVQEPDHIFPTRKPLTIIEFPNPPAAASPNLTVKMTSPAEAVVILDRRYTVLDRQKPAQGIARFLLSCGQYIIIAEDGAGAPAKSTITDIPNAGLVEVTL